MSGDSASPADTLVEALAAVMHELPAIGKDEKSPEGYNYRGIEQIAKHLQPLLAKHGVVIVPVSSFVSQHPSVAMKEGWTDTLLDVDWRICGHGEVIEARTQGIGRDKSDKGAAKALTQARKNLLLSLFSIADKADDADGQTYEHDRQELEPPASQEAREAMRARIGELAEGDKARAAAWIQEHKVPSLIRAGATLTQLNELADYITQLTTEPFEVPETANAAPKDGAAETGSHLNSSPQTSTTRDNVKPFEPVVFNPETGEQEPVSPNPAAVARKQLSGSERRALDSAARA